MVERLMSEIGTVELVLLTISYWAGSLVAECFITRKW